MTITTKPKVANIHPSAVSQENTPSFLRSGQPLSPKKLKELQKQVQKQIPSSFSSDDLRSSFLSVNVTNKSMPDFSRVKRVVSGQESSSSSLRKLQRDVGNAAPPSEDYLNRLKELEE
ncbi:MAG: hypothetical protein AAGJ35_02040 [Myxococcota bacterium]